MGVKMIQWVLYSLIEDKVRINHWVSSIGVKEGLEIEKLRLCITVLLGC